MRHKTKIDWEDGVSYRIDDPECTCRKCLLDKLQKSEKERTRLAEELSELIERPVSGKSNLIRQSYIMLKKFTKDLSDAYWTGSITNQIAE